MSPVTDTIVEANQHLLTSVEEQIRDLQPGLQNQVETAVIEAELRRLKTLVDKSSLIAALKQSLIDAIATMSGTKNFADFGEVLLDLYSFQQSLQAGLEQQQITDFDKEKFESALLSVIKQVRQLLNYRPDVNAIMDDLTAMKNLRGGPADATAFHDFQVLQLAFESVWMNAFDDNFKNTVVQLYEEAVRLYEDAGVTVPDFGALNDIEDLKAFVNEIIKDTGLPNSNDSDGSAWWDVSKWFENPKPTNSNPAGSIFAPPPLLVTAYFPEAVAIWILFSDDQRNEIIRCAEKIARLSAKDAGF